MVVVPAGTFTMGSPDEERRWAVSQGAREELLRSETPQHRVTIERPFAVGRFEVTRGEFAAFVDDTDRDMAGGCYVWTGSKVDKDASKGWRNPGFVQTDRDAVACVSWDDAKAYIAWLAQRTGKGYRLLSEAEWEYVARAGTTTSWSCGASEGCLGSVAWYSANAVGWTQPVGGKAANAFGLHDAHGNVREWVEDCLHGSYAGAPADGSAWTAGGECRVRVLRGGAVSGAPGDVRSASRHWDDSGSRFLNFGFRVARTLD